MRFWDSSALIPLLVDEVASAGARALLDADHDVAAAWTTEIECASAVARLLREGRLTPDAEDAVLSKLARTARRWMVAEPTETMRRGALRLVRVHNLRAADALQLAAALTFAEGHPASLPLVSLDDRLVDAARREGFPVVVPRAD
jgi:hypothetical protein